MSQFQGHYYLSRKLFKNIKVYISPMLSNFWKLGTSIYRFGMCNKTIQTRYTMSIKEKNVYYKFNC